MFRRLVLSLLFLSLAFPASAAVTVVANGNDSGPGSFRQAVTDSLPGDIVEIPSSMTVTLTASLDITKNLGIRGGGSLTGNVSPASADYLVKIDASRVVFDNIALKNVSAVRTSVYIVSQAAVNFLNCDISGNTATGDLSVASDQQAYGGAVSISSGASAVFVGCTLSANESRRGRGGGAVYTAQGGSVYFAHCVFSGNTAYGAGGGLYAFDSASASLLGCTFDANTAGTDGGGVYVRHDSTLNLVNCTFTGNTSGARGNTGAGAGGALTVHENSTATLTNCTFYANTVNSGSTVPDGGAIYTEPDSITALTGCTLLKNTARRAGGGIHVNNGATVYLSGTILADNSVADVPQSSNLEVRGALISSGYNLMTGNIDVETGGIATWVSTGPASDDLAVSDAASIFGDNAPADNGGFVPTVMIIDDDRYAWDRIPANNAPLVDARGLLRPNPPATQAAIGAVEYGTLQPPTAVSITGPDSIVLGEMAQYRVALTPDSYRGVEMWGTDAASTASALLSGDIATTNGTCTVEPLSAGQLRLTAKVRVAGTTLYAAKDIAVTEPFVPPAVRVLMIRPVSVDVGTETTFGVRFSRVIASAEVTITGVTTSQPTVPVDLGSPDATAGSFRATLPLAGPYLFGFETLDFRGNRDADAKIVEAKDRPVVVVPALLSLVPTTVSTDVETEYRATFNTPLVFARVRLSSIASPDEFADFASLSLSDDGLSGTFPATLPAKGDYLFAFTLTSSAAEGTSTATVHASAVPHNGGSSDSGGCQAAGAGLLGLSLLIGMRHRPQRR